MVTYKLLMGLLTLTALIEWEAVHDHGVWTSIQEPEDPERDLISTAKFYSVYGQEAVFNILDLFKTLSGAAHFKQILSVHQKIAFSRIIHVADSAQLIVEEGFPDSSNLRVAGQSVHKIGIV